MTAESIEVRLQSRLRNPIEDKATEYKQWLDITIPDDQANLARALIALVNFGGGQVILGFRSDARRNLEPADDQAPANTRTAFPAELIQEIVTRYSTESFEVSVNYVQRSGSAVVHPVIEAPAGYTTIVFAKRGSPDNRTLLKGKLYTRLAGPRTDTPQTAAEWSEFADGLVHRRQDQLIQLLRPVQVSSDTSAASLPEGSEPKRRTVRDRMSDKGALPSAADVSVVAAQLDSEDAHVLRSQVSERRVEEFRDGISRELTDSMPVVRLFTANGHLTRITTYDEIYRFGVRQLSFKGPFVENSNWHMMGEREFALAINGFLLRQWIELIEARVSDERLALDVETVRGFVRESRNRMTTGGASPDLVLFLNFDRSDPVLNTLWREHSWWAGARTFHGADMRGVTFIHGQLEGLPVLEFGTGGRPIVAVVDTTDFELLVLNPTPRSTDLVSFEVDPVTQETAAELLLKNPDLARQLYEGSKHTPGSYGTAEAILRLQLMAHYRLDCAAEVRERHIPRTTAAGLG